MVVSKESCQSSEKDQKQSSAKAQRLKAIEEGNEILIDEIVKLRELRHLILGVIPIVAGQRAKTSNANDAATENLVIPQKNWETISDGSLKHRLAYYNVNKDADFMDFENSYLPLPEINGEMISDSESDGSMKPALALNDVEKDADADSYSTEKKLFKLENN